MLAKHKLLGVTLMLGGAIMAYALSVKPKSAEPSVQKSTLHPTQETRIAPKTLATDIDTETKILLERQKEREARVKEQEEQMKSLIAKQELARAEALKKAEAETTTNLIIKPRPEVLAAQEQAKQSQAKATQEQAVAAQPSQPKASQTAKPSEAPKPNEAAKPSQTLQAKTSEKPNDAQKNLPKKSETKNANRHEVQHGDSLIRLAREYQVPVEALAQANNLSPQDLLQRGKSLKIPNKNDIKALQAKALQEEKAKAQQKMRKEKQRTINQRLIQARQDAKKQGLNEGYSVQVALASDKDKAQELGKKYKQAGYRVRLVEEARGVRVVVGQERSQAAASVLKEKLQNDPSVAASGAWVTKIK